MNEYPFEARTMPNKRNIRDVTGYYSPIGCYGDDVIASAITAEFSDLDLDRERLRNAVKRGLGELLDFIGMSGSLDIVTFNGERFCYGLKSSVGIDSINPDAWAKDRAESKGEINE